MKRYLVFCLAFAVLLGLASNIFAHCDTLDGPVVAAAKKALDTGDIKYVLIWVQQKDETEIKQAFDKTLAVRKKGPEAKDLADMYFFETIVRVHRAGEGVPYTGLKPSGAEVDPMIQMADKAAETGSVEDLATKVSGHVAKGIHERFKIMMEKKKHMNESVEAGREYVEAYVIFLHYAEGIHNAVMKAGAHGAEPQEEHK